MLQELQKRSTEPRPRLDAAERRARRYAVSRAWALANPERTRSYGRKHYEKYPEKRRANSRAYYNAHKAERAAYSREYYRRKKQEDPTYLDRLNARRRALRAEKRAARGLLSAEGVRLPSPPKAPAVRAFEALLRKCDRLLNRYTYTAMERVRSACGARVDAYLEQYPFEECAELLLRRRLARLGIYRWMGEYDDCYDAGMLAYLYTIHRCAFLQCDYVLPYLMKMLRIYVVSARLVYRDSHNLCYLNGFREIHLDDEGVQRWL